jgi:hypothetical protein
MCANLFLLDLEDADLDLMLECGQTVVDAENVRAYLVRVELSFFFALLEHATPCWLGTGHPAVVVFPTFVVEFDLRLTSDKFREVYALDGPR